MQIARTNKEMSVGKRTLEAIMKEVICAIGVAQQSARVAPQAWYLGFKAAFEIAHVRLSPLRYGTMATC
jgi:hypothetical protein